MSVATAQTCDGGLAVSARPYDALRTWLPFALILAAAMAVRHFVGANSDVSWEITLSEKILDGQRLYVDLIELNPPASTLLYLPAVALARAFGLTPEIVVDALVLTGALVNYNMVVFGFVVALLRERSGNTMRDHWLLIAVWTLPVTMMFAGAIGIPLAPVVLIAFACWLLRRLAQGDSRKVSTLPEATALGPG
jgi:hypothetical protein